MIQKLLQINFTDKFAVIIATRVDIFGLCFAIDFKTGERSVKFNTGPICVIIAFAFVSIHDLMCSCSFMSLKKISISYLVLYRSIMVFVELVL